MKPLIHRTKIVATIGPASDSPEMIRKMLLAGMVLEEGQTLTLLPIVEADLVARKFAEPGDKILVMGGIPFGQAGGTNFLKLHTIAQGE